jgi:hypothetical protein
MVFDEFNPMGVDNQNRSRTTCSEVRGAIAYIHEIPYSSRRDETAARGVTMLRENRRMRYKERAMDGS